MRILVIEDDAGIAAGLRTTLQQRGYAVDVCGDVASAWSALRTERFDAVLLDLGLPDADGSVLLQRLRSAPATVGASGAALPNPATPVLIVTARDQVQQRIAGLDMGADDYVAKPFSMRELILRVRAVLRRRDLAAYSANVVDFGRIRVDTAAHTAWVDGVDVSLTALEFRLLMLLIERRGRVQTREALLAEVWGAHTFESTRTIDTTIQRLRKKLADAGDYVRTVRGVGYRFVARPNEEPETA